MKKSYNFDRTKGEREARYMRPLPQKRKEHRNGEMVFLHSSECSQAIISAKAFQQLLFKDFKFQCVTEFLHQLVYFTTKIMARPVFFVSKACTVVNFTPGWFIPLQLVHYWDLLDWVGGSDNGIGKQLTYKHDIPRWNTDKLAHATLSGIQLLFADS